MNGTVYDFLVDHRSNKKKKIINIHKKLMVKKNIKQYLGLLRKYSLDYYYLS